MSTSLRIAIAEISPIIRQGIEAQLKKLPTYKTQISYIIEDATRDWQEALAQVPADVYILNPLLCGRSPRGLFSQNIKANFIAINTGSIDKSLLKDYDGILYITDQMPEIIALFDRLVGQEKPVVTESLELTSREREIVVCVVKGMTNKRIAEHLFLSTHTVITHRRNIGKKLQIHSASALAVYAIMNKLIDPKDINVLTKTSK